MTPGCTLVISPLVALISDQILHLEEAEGTCQRGASPQAWRVVLRGVACRLASHAHPPGASSRKYLAVRAVKITAATPKEQSRDITQQLTAMANRSLPKGTPEIKLCYVTVSRSLPEFRMP